MAIQTGIAPNAILEAPPEVQREMMVILAEKGEENRRAKLREALERG